MTHIGNVSILLNEISRCLFIVLGTIKLNEIKYARKSIFHVLRTPSGWIFPSTPGTHEILIRHIAILRMGHLDVFHIL